MYRADSRTFSNLKTAWNTWRISPLLQFSVTRAPSPSLCDQFSALCLSHSEPSYSEERMIPNSLKGFLAVALWKITVMWWPVMSTFMIPVHAFSSHWIVLTAIHLVIVYTVQKARFRELTEARSDSDTRSEQSVSVWASLSVQGPRSRGLVSTLRILISLSPLLSSTLLG